MKAAAGLRNTFGYVEIPLCSLLPSPKQENTPDDLRSGVNC